jgi:hypothetical protein
MAATYTPIASITLGAAAASVTFSSIPSTYTDLVIVSNFGSDSSSNYAPYVRFNSDTGTNYSHTFLYGTGSAAASARQSSATAIFTGNWGGAIGTSSIPTNIMHIMNYANTTTNKTILGRNNSADVEVTLSAGLWRNTAAITSIELSNYLTAKFTTGSTFNLYGILGANA